METVKGGIRYSCVTVRLELVASLYLLSNLIHTESTYKPVTSKVLVDYYERDLVAGAVRPRGQGLPREYDQEYDVSGIVLYQNNTSTLLQ
jgi:hypothetical protein